MIIAVVVVGFAVLFVLSTVIGFSMDTERRRAEWRREADIRRQQSAQRREAYAQRWSRI